MRKWLLTITVGVLMVGLLSACSAISTLGGAGTLSVPLAPAAGGGSGVTDKGASLPSTDATPVQVPSGIRSLTVTGTGRAALTPDIAYVNIGVQTQGTDVSEPLASNKTLTQKVVDALKAQGVDEKDIQTTNFNIYPQQNYSPTGEITSTRYVVDNTVYVTVRDLSKLGNLLDAAAAAGANNINGIQFDVSDKAAALADARKAAVSNGEEQAKQLAEAAGVQLGSIQAINTSTTNVPIPYYGMGMGGGGVAAPAASSVPISTGQIVVTVDVTIVYQIQ